MSNHNDPHTRSGAAHGGCYPPEGAIPLRAIMPYAKDGVCALYAPWLEKCMTRYDIVGRLRAAAFLAQIAHESMSLNRVSEIASGRAYTGATRLGNDKPEALAAARAAGQATGPFYKGRGLLMITGYDNYRACGLALGLDLVHQPDLLLAPEHAALSAAWYWDWKKLNPVADRGDFRAITRAINGGYTHYDERLAFYQRALAALQA